jgi:hypothetical protein
MSDLGEARTLGGGSWCCWERRSLRAHLLLLHVGDRTSCFPVAMNWDIRCPQLSRVPTFTLWRLLVDLSRFDCRPLDAASATGRAFPTDHDRGCKWDFPIEVSGARLSPLSLPVASPSHCNRFYRRLEMSSLTASVS